MPPDNKNQFQPTNNSNDSSESYQPNQAPGTTFTPGQDTNQQQQNQPSSFDVKPLQQLSQVAPTEQAQAVAQPSSDAPGSNNYDFIMNPEERPKPNPFANTKMPIKIAIIGGGFIVLLIVFNILRGFIAGPPVGEKFLSIAQEQQQILTIVESANKQNGISTANANSAITTSLGIATDQTNTLEYMAKNGKAKVKPKDLNLLLDAKITEQLETSAAAGTFNQTYHDVLKNQLNSYMNHLSVLYKQIDGKNGKTLLDNNYMSAKLLLQQLDTPGFDSTI